MKKRVIICFVCVVFIFSVINISALSTLETPTKVYNISLKFVDSSSAYITINNMNSPRLTIQNSPYYLNYPVEGLYLIVKDVHSAQYAGDISKVRLLLFLEQNLSEDNNFSTRIEIDKKLFNISVTILPASSVRIIINDINSPTLSTQNSPYYLNNPVEGLYPIAKDIHAAQYAGDKSRVVLLLAYEINITEECSENWTCSDWSICSNNLQLRTCSDSNNCGTVKDKPAENQSCASPNQLQNPVLPPTPKINCTNDIDCLVDGTGMPECKNNERCIPFISSKCINPGTSQSYCNDSLAERCTPCPNGCQNNQCINKPQPVKECETIGLRESGKYCSSQYKWANQKEDGILCENNFECKINSCFESKCGKEQTSQIAYWTGGALAIVIILFLIIYLRAKKQ
jgi:hypothetical protein